MEGIVGHGVKTHGQQQQQDGDDDGVQPQRVAVVEVQQLWQVRHRRMGVDVI